VAGHEWEIVSAMATVIATLAGRLYWSAVKDRDFWRARCQQLEDEARKTSEAQGREAEEWKRRALERTT